MAVFGLRERSCCSIGWARRPLKGLKAIFIEERSDEMLPWFIEGTRVKSETEVYVKLEGLDTKEAARRVVQKEVWLTEADFEQFAGRSAPISMVGFRLFDGGRTSGRSSK